MIVRYVMMDSTTLTNALSNFMKKLFYKLRSASHFFRLRPAPPGTSRHQAETQSAPGSPSSCQRVDTLFLFFILIIRTD